MDFNQQHPALIPQRPTGLPAGSNTSSSTREVEEVRSAMLLARSFPRKHDAVRELVVQACSRYELASQAIYSLPRGGKPVTGPSIRLAEAIAQLFTNMSYGLREVAQVGNQSEVVAYAVDLETNTRREYRWIVRHERYSRSGGNQVLEDQNEAQNLIGNHGARRLRSCLLSLLPGDLVEAAITQCKETLKKGKGEPRSERIAKMETAFTEIGITAPMLQRHLGHHPASCTDDELAELITVYRSLKDGVAKPSDFFSVPGGAADLNAQFVPALAGEGKP